MVWATCSSLHRLATHSYLGDELKEAAIEQALKELTGIPGQDKNAQSLFGYGGGVRYDLSDNGLRLDCRYGVFFQGYARDRGKTREEIEGSGGSSLMHVDQILQKTVQLAVIHRCALRF